MRIAIAKHNIGTPARVNRATQTLEINGKDFWSLPVGEQKAIIWHEFGHLNLDTSDELRADNYAMANYLDSEPNSDVKYLNAMFKHLDGNTKEHRKRLENSLLKVAEYDYHRNGNKKVKTIIDQLKPTQYSNFTGDIKPKVLSFQFAAIIILLIFIFLIFKLK